MKLIVDKFTIETYRTQPQTGQNVAVQRRKYEQLLKSLKETIETMDKKIELEDKKNSFSADKVGTSNEDIVKQMKQVTLTKILRGTKRLSKRLK